MKATDFKSIDSKNGTIFFQRTEKLQQVKIKGEVTAIELRQDKNNKPFYSLYILHEHDIQPTKWNLFKIEKADGLKIGDKIIGHGIYYGPNKRLLKHLKIVEAKT
jgi:hypothetical protein